MSHHHKFVSDRDAKLGVKKGIARIAGVSESDILVHIKLITAQSHSGCHVDVAFAVEDQVSGHAEADELLKRIQSWEPRALARAIQSEVEALQPTSERAKYGTFAVASLELPRDATLLDASGEEIMEEMRVETRTVADPFGSVPTETSTPAPTTTKEATTTPAPTTTTGTTTPAPTSTTPAPTSATTTKKLTATKTFTVTKTFTATETTTATETSTTVPATTITSTVTGHDCEAGFATWDKSWPPEKKKWCCKSTGRGCQTDLYDCYGPEVEAQMHQDWIHGWPEEHTKWCCSEKGIACSMSDSLLQAKFTRSVWPLASVAASLPTGLALMGVSGAGALFVLARRRLQQVGYEHLGQDRRQLSLDQALMPGSWTDTEEA